MTLGEKSWLDKVSLYLLAIFPVALLTSIAAMELLSWSLFLLAALSGVWFLFRGGRFSVLLSRWRLGPDWALWGFFFSLGLGAILFAKDSSQLIYIWGEGRWLFLLYAYAFFLPWILREARWQRVANLSFLVLLLIGIYAALQFYFGWEFTRSNKILKGIGENFRATGLFSLSLTFAYVTGMFGFVAVGMALRRPAQLWAWMGVTGAILCVGFSLTRGAWLGSVLTLVVVLTCFRRQILVPVLLSVSLLGGLAYWLNPSVQKRAVSLLDEGNTSNLGRIQIWQANLAIFQDHPILGVGLTQNKALLPKYYEQLGIKRAHLFSHAHNNLLQLMAGTGVVGTFFWLVFCFWFLRLAWQLTKRWGIEHPFGALAFGLLAAQIFFHIGGLTECNFTDGEVNHSLVFGWGLLVALSRQVETGEELNA